MLTSARTGLRLAIALVATASPLALSGPARADQVRAVQLECIGVVVDPAGSGSTRAPDTFCATVPYGATGQQVLAARAKALNRPQPRYQGGLLCAIDGFPETGCGQKDAERGGYDYWSYWHKKRGSSQWVYSGTGADQYSPVPGDLEGWAFQQGGAEGGRVPPAVSAESVCATARPAATTPTAAPPTRRPTPSRAPSAKPTSAKLTSAPVASAAPTSRRPTSRAPSPTPSVANTALVTGTTPTTPAPSIDPSVTTDQTGSAAAAPAPTTSTSGPVVVSPAVADAPAKKKSSGAPVGLIIAIVAVFALSGGAFARNRLMKR